MANVTPRSVPFTVNFPSWWTTSSGAASSRRAAIRRPRSMIFSVARVTAEPPTVRAPEPPLPRPAPSKSLSPQNTWMRSGGTPSFSLTICANAVSLPWPIDVEPANSETEPSALTRSSAVSGFIAV